MNRTELIEAIATQTDLSKSSVGRMLDAAIENIQKAVKKGEGVQLVGFGSFRVTKRAGRTGRNPRTGEPVKIAPAIVPRFTPGAAFKSFVDPKGAKAKAAKAKLSK